VLRANRDKSGMGPEGDLFPNAAVCGKEFLDFCSMAVRVLDGVAMGGRCGEGVHRLRD
jgi:hypothetical protein